MKEIPIYSERIRKAMVLRHYSQQDLADKCGINKTQISYYVNGRNAPKHDYAQRIANVLGVNEDWLLGYNVPMCNIRKANFCDMFDCLNEVGREKAEEYITDLLENYKYCSPVIRPKAA